MRRVHVELTEGKIDVEWATNFVRDDVCGGVCVFLGDVRGTTSGSVTEKLVYEAHQNMAEKAIKDIAISCSDTFSANVVIVHRLGTVFPGETSVICAAACAHRAEAFECCRELIDRLKRDVPIWKKEFADRGVTWPANKP